MKWGEGLHIVTERMMGAREPKEGVPKPLGEFREGFFETNIY